MLVVPTRDEQIVACPTCNTDVTIPATLEHDEVESRDDELDHTRITQRATLRRALYRSRSYAIIAAVVCIVAVVQLAFTTLHALRTRSFVWTAAYLLALIAAVWGARYFYNRAVAAHREATSSGESTNPESAPDFSTLSDGSQLHERLNDVR